MHIPNISRIQSCLKNRNIQPYLILRAKQYIFLATYNNKLVKLQDKKVLTYNLRLTLYTHSISYTIKSITSTVRKLNLLDNMQSCIHTKLT